MRMSSCPPTCYVRVSDIIEPSYLVFIVTGMSHNGFVIILQEYQRFSPSLTLTSSGPWHGLMWHWE